MIWKGLPLANLCQPFFWLQQESGVAVDASPFAMLIFHSVGMPLVGLYTDNLIPVSPRELGTGVLAEGADLYAHEPIVLVPVDDQGVASGFNRLFTNGSLGTGRLGAGSGRENPSRALEYPSGHQGGRSSGTGAGDRGVE